jgi:hypothetical protein
MYLTMNMKKKIKFKIVKNEHDVYNMIALSTPKTWLEQIDLQVW